MYALPSFAKTEKTWTKVFQQVWHLEYDLILSFPKEGPRETAISPSIYANRAPGIQSQGFCVPI